MEKQQDFSGLTFNSNRDKCFGSPIFDQLKSINNKNAISTLVLLPNGCTPIFFKAAGGFIKIIESFGNDLIFKTRKKQWMPPEIKKMGKEIVFDGDIMYPSAIVDVFPRTKNTVLFYSSGIYEAIFANQYVINVKFPLSLWPRDLKKLNKYFLGELYNYEGVIESVEQKDLVKGKFESKKINQESRKKWLEKYIGDISEDSSSLIVDDIIKSN
jgi:hypothetical protein